MSHSELILTVQTDYSDALINIISVTFTVWVCVNCSEERNVCGCKAHMLQ